MFTLADDKVKIVDERTRRSISKTLTTSLGRGLGFDATGENTTYGRKEPEGKTNVEKQNEWRRFQDTAAPELISLIKNSQPINTVRLEGIVRDGRETPLAVFRNNVSNIAHPNTRYFADMKVKGFKKKGLKVRKSRKKY